MDYIIIVAGGKGLRMGSDIPKQFLPIGGKPVLMRTLERFRSYDANLQITGVMMPTCRSSSCCQRPNKTIGASSVSSTISM